MRYKKRSVMDNNRYILEHFIEKLAEYGMEARLNNDEDICMIKAELNDLGRASNRALMEIMVLPYEVEQGQIIVQFYTTIAINMREGNIAPALRELNTMNVSIPVGAVHIFEDFKQLYHKHSVVLKEDWDEETKLEVATTALLNCLNIVDFIYDEALIISDDVANLAEFRRLVDKEAEAREELSVVGDISELDGEEIAELLGEDMESLMNYVEALEEGSEDD